METIALAGAGRSTSRLGFGCAYLTPESRRILDAAWEAGVRHFDVGRSYGRGLAELVLGDFLKRRPDATVTTKYGFVPPYDSRLHLWARGALRPLVRAVRPRAPARAGAAAGPDPQLRRAAFTAADAARSLDISLRNLGRARIDVFLMHEPVGGDLESDALLEFLEQKRSEGVIGDFGVGGPAARMPALLAGRTGYGRVLQHDWAADAPIGDVADAAFRILYRSVSAAKARLRSAAGGDDALADFSREVDLDLKAPGRLESLLWRTAMLRRPDALFLFSSTNPDHIRANVAAAHDASLDAPALRLIERLARVEA